MMLNDDECSVVAVVVDATACRAGTYGEGCRHTCQCPAGLPCNHVTGECSCPSGYAGLACERREYTRRQTRHDVALIYLS